MTPHAKCPDDFCSDHRRGSFSEDIPCRSDHEPSSDHLCEGDFLFHSACDACDQLEPEPLCNFCQHIRLHHLVVCLYDFVKSLWFSLDLDGPMGGLTRIMENEDCSFCTILADAARSYFHIIGRDEGIRAEEYCASLYLSQYHSYDSTGYDSITLELKGLEEHRIHLSISQILGKEMTLPQDTPGNVQLLQPLIDWPQVEGWIRECHSSHSCIVSNSRREFAKASKDFRLIDVHKNRVAVGFEGRSLGSDLKYVALSYVWGKTTGPIALLRRDNEDTLQSPGGLDKMDCPKTVRDAMTVCKRLGQRYLWVDRFCIVQDEDEVTKQQQIDAMSAIYSSAEFTIINAGGIDTHCPIWGVSEGREVLQTQAEVCGIELTNAHPDYEVTLERLEWAGRGWTYQEAVLSPLKVFFGRHEVWFECLHPHNPFRQEDRFWDWRGGKEFHDELNMEKFQLRSYIRHDESSRESATEDVDDIARHLYAYTSRSLTYRRDIINAFKGVLTEMYGGYNEHLYGLPEADFDQSLLWRTSRRAKDKPTWQCENTSWPSWSWASVDGKIDTPTDFYKETGFIGTLISWAYKGQGGKSEVIRVRSRNSVVGFTSNQDSSIRDSPSIHLLFAWWKGCIESPFPEDLLPLFECFDPEQQQWPTLNEVWQRIQNEQTDGLPEYQHLMMGLGQEDKIVISQLQPGNLLTRAQTSFFKLRLRYRAKCHYSILDAGGEDVGDIFSETNLLDEDDTHDPDLPKEGNKFLELMAMSLHRNFATGTKYPGSNRELHELVSQIFPDERDLRGRPAVNVLCIGPGKTPSFRRRLGVGLLYLEAWILAKREFHTIILE